MLVYRAQAIARYRRLLGILLTNVLILAGCLPLGDSSGSTPRITRGPIQRVTQTPFVFEPSIAVNPTNPTQLASMAIASSDQDCRMGPLGSCTNTLLLGTSSDNGATWQEQKLLATNANGVVAFDRAGMLHMVGILGEGVDRAIFYLRGVPTGVPQYQRLVTGKYTDKPWLTIDPATGTLYVTYIAPTQGEYIGVILRRSTDGGMTWSPPVVVDQGRIAFHSGAQVDYPPFNPHVLLLANNTVIVVWQLAVRDGFFTRKLWFAPSKDGGQTFAASQQLSEATSSFDGTFAKGVAYVLYQRGEAPAQLVLARSDNSGATWSTSVVAGDLPHYIGQSPPAAISVAPNGTLDIVFYAPTEACIDREAALAYFQKRLATQFPGWIDQCKYHVYYTWSTDGGLSFQPPQQLTDQPIAGSSFVQLQKQSRPGDYIGIASNDKDAYPIWLAGTQASMMQIHR